MCGLFGGASTHLVAKELEVIRDLGILSQFRGFDSTGLAVSKAGKKRKNTQFSYLKDTIDSSGFFLEAGGHSFLASSRVLTAVIGHCRAATVGAVTKENAHPYDVGNILGSHNGTIPSLTPPTGTDGTDSHALFRLIEADGLEETLNTLPNSAAYALTYFDKKHEVLHLIRNQLRPLFLATAPGCLYWASEIAFLTLVAARHNITYNSVQELDSMSLYSIPLGTMHVTKREITLAPKALHVYHTSLYPVTRYTPPDNKHNLSILNKKSKKEKPTSLFSTTFSHTSRDSTAPSTQDAPTFIFPTKPVNGYPMRVLLKHSSDPKDTRPQTCKILKYRHGNGKYLNPDDVVELLERGCSITHEIASIYDKVYWLNETEYVLEAHKENDIACALSELGAGVCVAGKLVYISFDELRNQINLLRTKGAI